MLEIRRGNISEVLQEKHLLAEYARESGMPGMPEPKACMEAYLNIEASGMLHVLCACVGTELVGFLVLLINNLPHYGATVAVNESFFVAKQYRCTGAGVKLRKAAESLAVEQGAVGILASAPAGGSLAVVLPRSGYLHTGEVFFKRLV